MKDFNFQPFDKVLVRETDKQNWRCSFFSHKPVGCKYFCSTNGVYWEHMIPYNENTKHLLGTSEPYISPEEAPKFEFGDVVEWVSYGKIFTGIYVEDRSPKYFGVLSLRHGCVDAVKKPLLKLIRKGNFNG